MGTEENPIEFCNCLPEIISELCKIYEPTEVIKDAELFSISEIIGKISAIVPEITINPIELKTELEKAGFIYKALKGNGDFNFYWLLKEKASK